MHPLDIDLRGCNAQRIASRSGLLNDAFHPCLRWVILDTHQPGIRVSSRLLYPRKRPELFFQAPGAMLPIKICN